MTDQNCLSYWFPKIEAAGLPVPKTVVIRTALPLVMLFDGKPPEGFGAFVDQLRVAAESVGFPCFLRTGQGSGKHQWRNTCYLPSAEALPQHVYNLVEWSECVDWKGLPFDVWAVREMLPTMPICALPFYEDMPLCREFRVFVEDATVRCSHPYWPWKAIVQGCPFKSTASIKDWDSEDAHEIPSGLREQWESLCQIDGPTEIAIRDLASRAGQAVGGAWSVDVLETTRGWHVTDMAVAKTSYHWPGCDEQKRGKRKR